MERAVGRFEADDAEVFFGEAFDVGRDNGQSSCRMVAPRLPYRTAERPARKRSRPALLESL